MGTSPPPAAGRQPSDLIQSLQRGLHVLEWVAGAHRPVAPREIAHALGLNVGTTYHLVNTLVYEGYLRREQGGRLVLGRRPCVPAGPAALSPVSVAVSRALGKAAFAVEDVALIAELRDGEAVIRAVQEVEAAPNAGRYAVASARLAHVTAVGRVMLASLPDDAVAPTVARVGALAAERDEIFHEAGLLRELAEIRRTGVSYEVAEGEACVAAPVLGARREPLGGLALVVTPDRARRDPAPLATLTRRAASAVGRAIGGHRWAQNALPATDR